MKSLFNITSLTWYDEKLDMMYIWIMCLIMKKILLVLFDKETSHRQRHDIGCLHNVVAEKPCARQFHIALPTHHGLKGK